MTMDKRTADTIIRMAAALRSARRVLADLRREEWEGYTIPPDRSFDHMNADERRSIRRYDRVLKKINEAMRS